jgi:hypothetical protein
MTPGNDWAEQGRRLFEALRGGPGDAAPDGASTAPHSSDCRWCPLCQVASVVRGERPEVTAALADVLAAAATALRTFAAAPGTAASAADPDADAGSGEAGDQPAVQRIDIA